MKEATGREYLDDGVEKENGWVIGLLERVCIQRHGISMITAEEAIRTSCQRLQSREGMGSSCPNREKQRRRIHREHYPSLQQTTITLFNFERADGSLQREHTLQNGPHVINAAKIAHHIRQIVQLRIRERL